MAIADHACLPFRMETTASRHRAGQAAAALVDVGGEADDPVGGVGIWPSQCASVSSMTVLVDCDKLLCEPVGLELPFLFSVP